VFGSLAALFGIYHIVIKWQKISVSIMIFSKLIFI
jgi:hypothetical protein